MCPFFSSIFGGGRYLAFQAIHAPDEVPREYSDKFTHTIPDTPDGVGKQRRTVAGMISCLDEAMGNVTDALKATNMLDDTIIVFTAGEREGAHIEIKLFHPWPHQHHIDLCIRWCYFWIQTTVALPRDSIRTWHRTGRFEE